MSFISGNALSKKEGFNCNSLSVLREEKQMPFIKRGNIIYYLEEYSQVSKDKKIIKNNGCVVLTIGNNKGGVNKTTSTINIGSSLAFYGYKVLLIDMDMQCNLTRHFNIKTKSIVESINTNSKPEIKRVENDIYRFGALDIIANDLTLELEPNFDYKKLESVLESVKDDYDFIIFDTPPRVDNIIPQCLHVSDFVFMVLKPDEYSTIGAIKFLELLSHFDVKLLGGLITSNHKTYSTDIVAIENIQSIFSDLDSHICPTRISNSNIFNEIAMIPGKNSLLEYQPKHKCTSEYLQVADYVIHNIVKALNE